MRKLAALAPLAAAVVSLTACSGGGGTASAPATLAPPSGSGSVPASQYATPQFTITIPARSASKARKPQFVSSATVSVKITLTADSNGVDPTTLVGNPKTTNVNGQGQPSCATGCTIDGPPVPPGTDTFVVTTYDQAGNALDTTPSGGVTPPVISAGSTFNVAITLLGIPNGFTLSGVPTGTAGTSSATSIGPSGNATATLNVTDADGQTIAGTYANPVTLGTTETNGDGIYFANSCPAYPTGNTAQTGSSVTFSTSSNSTNFCYGGIAENPVTFTAKATGANTLTATFSPALATPVYVTGSGTPADTVITAGARPDVSLFQPSGDGSTGSLNYSEAGFTEDPYDQILTATPGTCSIAGPFSTYATLATAGVTGASGSTELTVTAIASPTAGVCPINVADGLTLNSTDTTATFDTSYTSSSIGVTSRPRSRR